MLPSLYGILARPARLLCSSLLFFLSWLVNRHGTILLFVFARLLHAPFRYLDTRSFPALASCLFAMLVLLSVLLFLFCCRVRQIVTCAADGQVRLTYLSRATSTLLGRHEGRAHRLAIEPGSPHRFMTCGKTRRYAYAIDGCQPFRGFVCVCVVVVVVAAVL